jgi:hypothetical protein
MPSETYPNRIPRERAVAALDLANKLLDYDEDLEGDENGDVMIPTDTWESFKRLAELAAKERA